MGCRLAERRLAVHLSMPSASIFLCWPHAATMAPPEQDDGDDAIRSIRGGYIVSKLPPDASKESIVAAMQKAAAKSMAYHQHSASSSAPPASSLPDIHVDLRPNPADPISSYAFVTPLWLSENATRVSWVEGLERSLLADGLRIGDNTRCKVKKRRPPKRDRVAQNEQREASKRRARDWARAKRPRWQPELLDKFDARDHSLDPHIFVANLDKERLRLVQEVYLPFVFPKSCREEVIGALRHVWTNHPKSLRVKEMFETLEAFRLIEKQISLLMARRREEQKDQLTTIYDLACGHGLLGVVLAYRFADVRVVCVDMERRTCFDHYLEGFQLHGKAAEGEAHPLSNLEFLEQDFTTLREEDIGGSRSFITMIHGCNEATKLAIEMAQKHGAAYAFMPCCIRDGLYGNVSRVAQVDDGTRHTVMVGLVAGQYGAHFISAIDQRITNRNLVIFGGYSLHDEEGSSVGGNNEGNGATFHHHKHAS